MAMQIAHQEDVSVLLQLLDHALQVIDCRVKLARWVNIASVQIHSGKITSGAAVDNAIDIEHGNNLEDEVVTQDLSLQERSS